MAFLKTYVRDGGAWGTVRHGGRWGTGHFLSICSGSPYSLFAWIRPIIRRILEKNRDKDRKGDR